MADCNCWQCQAERLFSARRTRYMRPGKVYMYQLYNELFEEFDRMEFARAHGLEALDGSRTVEQFIALCENSYGGSVIKKLKEYYKEADT